MISRILITGSFLLFVGYLSVAQTVFTSVASGDWDDCNTWGTCPGSTAGVDFPGETDDVNIAHAITVDNTLDNDINSTEEQPNNFSGVCGANHNNCGADSFYHNGKIIIDNGGQLTSSVPFIISDTLDIKNGGTFLLNDNSADVWVLGFLTIRAGGYFEVTDNLNLSGFGIATLESGGTGIIGDDLFFDGDNSFLCGDGTWDLNGGGTNNESIRAVNNDGETLDQICAETSLSCSDGDCCGGDCTTDISDNASDGTLNANEPPSNNRPSQQDVLPVELISFRAAVKKGKVEISWSTLTETDNSHFIVQRSADGDSYQDIARKEGQGSSSQQQDYLVEDNSPHTGVNYYRLIQIDFDGTSTYSYVISAFAFNETSLNVYPNPVSSKFNIRLDDRFMRTNLRLMIYNISGSIMLDKTFDSQLTNSQLGIDHQLLPGVYLLELSNHQYKDQLTFVVK